MKRTLARSIRRSGQVIKARTMLMLTISLQQDACADCHHFGFGKEEREKRDAQITNVLTFREPFRLSAVATVKPVRCNEDGGIEGTNDCLVGCIC